MSIAKFSVRNSVLVNLLMTGLFLFGCSNAIAGCTSCFTLQDVEIELSGSTKIVGYVEWNELWFYAEDSRGDAA